MHVDGAERQPGDGTGDAPWAGHGEGGHPERAGPAAQCQPAQLLHRDYQRQALDLAAELGVAFGIVDLSLAPTPTVGDSIGQILKTLGIARIGVSMGMEWTYDPLVAVNAHLEAGHFLLFLLQDRDDIHGSTACQADGHQLHRLEAVIIAAHSWHSAQREGEP